MADNDRVELNLNDLPHEQLSEDGLARTVFAPGRADGRVGDANWEHHFRSPVGLVAFESGGPMEIERTRILKLQRGIVCDQTIAAPEVNGTTIVTVTSAPEWGTVSPEHTVTDTTTQDVNGSQERTSGYDMEKA